MDRNGALDLQKLKALLEEHELYHQTASVTPTISVHISDMQLTAKIRISNGIFDVCNTRAQSIPMSSHDILILEEGFLHNGDAAITTHIPPNVPDLMILNHKNTISNSRCGCVFCGLIFHGKMSALYESPATTPYGQHYALGAVWTL